MKMPLELHDELKMALRCYPRRKTWRERQEELYEEIGETPPWNEFFGERYDISGFDG